MRELILSCLDFNSRNCCTSCHEDAETLDYQLMDIESPGKHRITAYVCCSIFNNTNWTDRRVWAIALRFHRSLRRAKNPVVIRPYNRLTREGERCPCGQVGPHDETEN